MDPEDDRGRRRAEARAEAAELERAHHLLDLYGVPREFREESGRRLEYSLEGRLKLVLADAEEG